MKFSRKFNLKQAFDFRCAFSVAPNQFGSCGAWCHQYMCGTSESEKSNHPTNPNSDNNFIFVAHNLSIIQIRLRSCTSWRAWKSFPKIV